MSKTASNQEQYVPTRRPGTRPAPHIRLRRALRRLVSPLEVLWLRHLHTGRGTYIDPTVQVLGWKRIRFGKDCSISEHCLFNVNCNGTEIEISIGDSSFVGRRNTFSSGKAICVGPYFLSGPDCKVIGSDHKFDDPFRPYVCTGNTIATVIEIGANCWFGASVSVIGNVSIGHGSVIGAGSMVLRDIPPFSLVVGQPARVLRRYDMKRRAWVPVGEYSDAQEAELPDEQTYLEMLNRSYAGLGTPRPATGKAWGDRP